MVTILFIVLVSIIGILIFRNWLNNFEPTSTYDKNNNETKTNDSMTKGEKIKSEIINVVKKNGFVENENDLKIYDQLEKSKDDYFDNVFEINCTLDREKYNENFAMLCLENIKNGEQVTLIYINPNISYNISFNINNKFTDTRLKSKLKRYIRKEEIYSNMYVVEDIDWYLCFSQREIEKQAIEENIAKLNIPDYITYSWNIDDNSLHFYLNNEEVEHLTISKEDLTKEKILQNIEECKKIYSKKNENIKTVKDKINDIFK